MSIYMVGIDHSQAGVDVRANFSYTKSSMEAAMEQLQQIDGIAGCVILSTCNRMEVWVNAGEDCQLSLYEWLCEDKKVDAGQYREYFSIRQEEDAVNHLFHLACGLKSQILGEDQIVTQVGDAIAFAREKGFSDSVLEVLFRKAVTAAKKVKTEVYFPKGNTSVISQAIRDLESKGNTLAGKQCMVVGNGDMGKTAAVALLEAGAKVKVTVRQYRHGKVKVPDGCESINYDDRMYYIPECDFVVSATSSPHYTITKEMLEMAPICKPLTIIDLAVPRDVEPTCDKVFSVTCYDMDDFHVDKEDEKLIQAKVKAEQILDELIEEFYQWLHGHDVISRIQFVKEEAVKDMELRVSKYMRQAPMDEDEKWKLQGHYDKAAEKVINKMIFGLRDCLEPEAFLACIDGLEKLYEE
ncbi:MAG: glutamyl-tRNA reductase [Lachnospiraceae bacterium]|nr:glutamyl-tRNA reductase [Lachnospiraceae bacterium]MDD3617281.1 glutamyl-tRNA reductase [Lachnospiraceae bacterium]